MNACSALWLTPSRTRTKCTRGGCKPDAKACANAAAAASKSAWLTFDVSVAFELGQTTPLHAQNTQNMPLRHEGATVLLASRPHQSAHIAVCCVAADQHDAFASMMRKERERVSVESFLRSTVTCMSSPPPFNRAWNWGGCRKTRPVERLRRGENLGRGLLQASKDCIPTRTHLSPLLTPTPWTARLTS